MKQVTNNGLSYAAAVAMAKIICRACKMEIERIDKAYSDAYLQDGADRRNSARGVAINAIDELYWDNLSPGAHNRLRAEARKNNIMGGGKWRLMALGGDMG